MKGVRPLLLRASALPYALALDGELAEGGDKHMYRDIVKQATNCTDAEVSQFEDLMRNVIFESTLDWQTREELIAAARVAEKIARYVSSLR